MTMERYSHRSTEADKAAAAALQSYFADALTENRGGFKGSTHHLG